MLDEKKPPIRLRFPSLWEELEDLKKRIQKLDRGFAKKPYQVKFGFVDVLKIVLVTTLCGFGIALGFWLFGIVIHL